MTRIDTFRTPRTSSSFHHIDRFPDTPFILLLSVTAFLLFACLYLFLDLTATQALLDICATATLPVFLSAATPERRTITRRDGSTSEMANWVTFDLTQISAIQSVDAGTQVNLRDGTQFVILMWDNELKYIMATKASMDFVGFDYKTESDAARAFDPVAFTATRKREEEAA